MHISFITRVLCLLLFMLGSFAGQSETCRAANVDKSLSSEWLTPSTVKPKAQKLGFFKKIRMANQFRKAMKKDGKEGERASPMARTALWLFIGGLASALLLAAILAALAFLASIILAFIVLFSEDNRKSKAIAKTILIISGIPVALAILYLLAIVVILTAIFIFWQ